mmetsp:Transcript_27830/g.43446  ORF Transcript_27830/g.43446 Transcript_27830/m.43446 type:complete len:350 (-) Transcript_27830:565-1614(-)
MIPVSLALCHRFCSVDSPSLFVSPSSHCFGLEHLSRARTCASRFRGACRVNLCQGPRGEANSPLKTGSEQLIKRLRKGLVLKLSMSLAVIGITGVTGSGKSTLCDQIAEFCKGPEGTEAAGSHSYGSTEDDDISIPARSGAEEITEEVMARTRVRQSSMQGVQDFRVEIVSGDNYFLPVEQCPQLDLGPLWAGTDVPGPLRTKKSDTNHPDCMNWPEFLTAIRGAKSRALHTGAPLLLVESFLLLSNEDVVNELDHVAFLYDFSPDQSKARSEIMHRKWERAHLGKASYKERGLSIDDYRIYWEHYVWERYLQYGRFDRLPEKAQLVDYNQPALTIAEKVLKQFHGTLD